MKKTRRESSQNKPQNRPEPIETKVAQRPGTSGDPSRERWIYVWLLIATLAVYGQMHNYEFINFDDGEVISGNAHVNQGFTLDGLKWAFTSTFAANWFPLTWMSHMLDCQLFGLDAGWHHLTNAVIHTAAVLLLFAVMKRMTGRIWESAFVAFVFALHPQHVESVAWVTERKDVLNAFFWFLTTWVYLYYLDQRKIGRYLMVLLCFALGLMTKQMIVTLPFVLLLLDVWPLKRKISRGVILEKVPLIAMAAIASVVTFIAQRSSGAVRALDLIPLSTRFGNAIISYVAYLVKFLWPTGLAVFYPYPTKNWPAWEVAGAAALLIAVSVLAVRNLRERPYLAVGWFWYLGTLVPVIGIIQVGDQARADRYTYIPLIGISMMLAWGAAEIAARWPQARTVIVRGAAVVCAAWFVLTFLQVQYWKNNLALFTHAIAVTQSNYLAHLNLGTALAAQQNTQDALVHLRIAVEEKPEHADSHASLGGVYGMIGRQEDAVAELKEAIRIDPNHSEAHCNLGNTYVAMGKMDEAARELKTAMRLNPGLANSYFGLANIAGDAGRLDEAIYYFNEALKRNPNFKQAQQGLEYVLNLKNHPEQTPQQPKN